MTFIKALLAGLVCVSLSMSKISGIITDTSGVTPIAGAIVQLENGGQKDTTEADGSFTLTVGTTGTLPNNGKLSLNSLSARISGNTMTVTMPEKSAVEIIAFDFSGKSIFTEHKTLEAGNQHILLPMLGTGVIFYEVNTGNRRCVLKGNIIDGVSYGSWVRSQGSSSKFLLKQAKTDAGKSNTISVIKDGKLNYRCVIANTDTSGIVIKMIANAGNVTDKDGNVYQSVRIGTQVWMVENLRTTKYNDGSSITFDTSSVTWPADTAGKYCFYKNTTNAESIKKFGALYNWYAVNTGKLALVGWHVPTDAEWEILENYLIDNGYDWERRTTDDRIAKSLAAQTDWEGWSKTGTIGCDLAKNNSSGFSALPGGYRQGDGYFADQILTGFWWNTTAYDADNALSRYLIFYYDYLSSDYNLKSAGFSVRLVKD